MPPQPNPPFTIGGPSFNPDTFFATWNSSVSSPAENDLQSAIIQAFKLKPNDDYVYHAIASVNLAQVQSALKADRRGGLCAWYRDEQGNELDPPPAADISAYTNVFAPSTVTSKALTGFAANAKKGSLRANIAGHLQTNFHPPTPNSKLTLPNKQKTSPVNPYLDLWAWSCQALHWAGPTADMASIRQSHHLLPVFYHHFGCVVPSFDAVHLLAQLAQTGGGSKTAQREIIEIGSGNGYWTFVLRRHGLTVTAVDNGLSAWRTMWIGDTVAADGVAYLQKRQGAKDAVLLLVYPQVSADFTSKVIKAYQGDFIAVAGTQNRNGYTGFAEEVVDAWMGRERREFEKVVQIPLPSFAAKDEALFIFERTKER